MSSEPAITADDPMPAGVAIRVRNVSKMYQIYDKPQDRLKQSIYPRLQRALITYMLDLHTTKHGYVEIYGLAQERYVRAADAERTLLSY